jgi:16S rRNA G966 N2-methylase RsmD
MLPKILLASEIQSFIKNHIKADLGSLGLKKPPNADWPYKDILNQIRARQKARNKIPDWANNFDLILPHPDVVEQASSSATAALKASWIAKTLQDNASALEHFTDLTGGSGIDSAALAQSFKSGTVIDSHTETAEILAHNFKILGNGHIRIEHGNSEAILADLKNTDLIYVDPARRTQNRKGHFKFEDCSPDIMALMPIMLKKAKHILIKASPMLDIHQSLKTLPPVTTVLCVEWDKQCKEVLYYIRSDQMEQKPTRIQSVSIDNDGKVKTSHSFTLEDEKNCEVEYSTPLSYLYDPGPAFMKAGGFKMLASDFEVKKLYPSTHLYTSDDLNQNFPGRIFKVEKILSASLKNLNVKKANIITRNYPLTPDQFKKRHKIKDGGDTYVFCCTIHAEIKSDKTEKTIILASRV